MKQKTFILDTSAILSGKTINFKNAKIITTPGVSDEISPGGKSYRSFQLLKEQGLEIRYPTEESVKKIDSVSNQTGDANRLSKVDKEVLSLALDIKKKEEEAVILTDDYSIQNMATFLEIDFENVSQEGIKKKYRWHYQCTGCRKKFEENIKVCPICGSATKTIITKSEKIGKKESDQ